MLHKDGLVLEEAVTDGGDDKLTGAVTEVYEVMKVAVDDEGGDYVTDAVTEGDEDDDDAGKALPLKQVLRLDL